jgi:dienelactone hydrolase
MKTSLLAFVLSCAVTLPLSAQTTTVFDTVFYSDEHGDRIATMYVPDASESNGVGVALGHWWTGERQTMRVWAESLAANGYVAMAFDYYDFRHKDSICMYPKPVTTFKLAVEFLRRGAQRFGLTTGKVAGLGQSEGAIHWGQAIVWDNDDEFFGTDSTVDDRLDAAVLLYGAYDYARFLSAPQHHMDQNMVPYFSLNPDFRYTKGSPVINVANVTTPVLLFHGTEDVYIRYEQSVMFHDSLIAHGKVSELHILEGRPHAFDIEWQTTKEFTGEGINTKDIVLRFLEMHVLLPPGMAAGEEVDVRPLYVSPQGDSLYITGKIRNPASHPVTVRAIIEAVQTSYKDSVELFDDGQHGDGGPADNLFGGVLDVSGMEENIYKVGLRTYDGSFGLSHGLRKGPVFTTAGPLVPARSDAFVNEVYYEALRLHKFRLALENLGSSASVTDVSAEISCDDPRLTVKTSNAAFDAVIPAGGVDTSKADCIIAYAEGYGPDSLIANPATFTLVVYSGNIAFWGDTLNTNDLVVSVELDRERLLPESYSLKQNYPNPFNPSTTIEFALPHAGYITLTVHNVLGQEVATLIAGDHAAGSFKATWDATEIPSGVYFYRLTAGEYVQTKKMVLMR